MSEELLPCPFCNGKAEICGSASGWSHWVECCGINKCGCSISAYDTLGEAVEKWNTRTPARLESLKQLQQESEKLGLYGLSEKQRERREFVKSASIENIGRWVGEACIVEKSLELWEEVDRKLAELEDKEGCLQDDK